MIEILFKLLIGHAIADFALQSDWMAKHKSRKNSLSYVPWYYVLTAHALIHGGAVYIITGSLLLGILETLLHWIIDFAKCENWTNIHVDQAFHILCKVYYL